MIAVWFFVLGMLVIIYAVTAITRYVDHTDL